MVGIDGLASAKAEDLPYYDPDYDYYDQLEEVFGLGVIDDITDIDNEDSYEYSYLVSLNRDGIRLSEGIDDLLEQDDAYFMNVLISREKPIASINFWKYPKGSRGQELIVSDGHFLEEQAFVHSLFGSFVRDHELLFLTEAELQEPVLLDGRKVSIYYKYFNRSE